MTDEPKDESLDQEVDKFLEDEEVPGESSAPNTPTEPKEEDGSDPEKTPSTPEEPSGDEETPKDETPEDLKGVDKGFATHPKWIERENKLKEAQGKLKEYESKSTQYSDLLGDPVIYKRHLERQGYSEAKISEMMSEKGFEVESPKSKGEMYEEICTELGWDVKQLDSKQKQYVRDLVNLNSKVAEKIVNSTLTKRLGPLEKSYQEQQSQREMYNSYEEAKKQAKEELPELDWDKEIEPAMKKYLDDLDAKDPDKKIKLDYQTLYEKATRQILKEKREQNSRQEERDGKKKAAKPLVPGAKSVQLDNKLKGKTVSETFDKAWESLGARD